MKSVLNINKKVKYFQGKLRSYLTTLIKNIVFVKLHIFIVILKH